MIYSKTVKKYHKRIKIVINQMRSLRENITKQIKGCRCHNSILDYSSKIYFFQNKNKIIK
jgi:hypothetical protein